VVFHWNSTDRAEDLDIVNSTNAVLVVKRAARTHVPGARLVTIQLNVHRRKCLVTSPDTASADDMLTGVA
jgi:hypothetical protein